jgi:hypothetical protein
MVCLICTTNLSHGFTPHLILDLALFVIDQEGLASLLVFVIDHEGLASLLVFVIDREGLASLVFNCHEC